VNDAEQILLSNHLVYRAIELNIRLFRWKRALQLAVQHSVHIDTVVAFRNQYLLANNLTENMDLFNEQSLRIGDIDAKQYHEIDNARKKEINKVCFVFLLSTFAVHAQKQHLCTSYIGISPSKQETL